MRSLRKMTLGVITLFLTLQVLAPSALAAGSITGAGLFTDSNFDPKAACDATALEQIKAETEAKVGDKEAAKKEMGIGDQKSTKTQDLMKDGVDPMIKDAAGFFDMKECGRSGGFINYLLKPTDPVTVTNNPVVMSITGSMQMLALVLAAVMVVFYAITYTMGNQKEGPTTFIIKMFVSVVAVMVLPYLVQDILNLNNVIIHSLSQVSLSLPDGSTLAAGGALVVVQSIATLLGMGIGITIGAPYLAVFGIILAIIVVYQLLKPLIQLTIWWYMRLLMIFLLTILGPLFVIGLALPQTARYTSNWIHWIISEVFGQIFVVLGFYLAAQLMMNIGTIMGESEMGLLGMVIFMYAIVTLLNGLPELAEKLLGGGLQLSSLRNASESLNNLAKSAIVNGGFAAARQGSEKVDKLARQAKIDSDANFHATRDMEDFNSRGGGKNGFEESLKKAANSEESQNQLRQNGGQDINSLDEGKKKEGIDAASDKFKGMLNQVNRGKLSRADAVQQMAKQLEDSGLAGNEFQARAMAGQMMSDFEDQTKLGWDTKNEIGRLSASGDLNKRNLGELIRADAQSKGVTDGRALREHMDQVMQEKGFNQTVGDLSERQQSINKLNNSAFARGATIDGNRVNRARYDDKGSMEGARLAKGQITEEEQQRAIQDIHRQGAAQSQQGASSGAAASQDQVQMSGAQGSVDASPAAPIEVNDSGTFSAETSQQSLQNDRNGNKPAMQSLGTQAGKKEGSYQMMYSADDASMSTQAMSMLPEVGTKIQGQDGNTYEVASRSNHGNGVVSADVQQVVEGGSSVAMPSGGEVLNTMTDQNGEPMKASMTSQDAQRMSSSSVRVTGADGGVVSAPGDSLSFQGAVQNGSSTQMVYQGAEGEQRSFDEVSQSMTPIGTLTTDSQGNVHQVVSHSDMGNGAVAVNMEMVQMNNTPTQTGNAMVAAMNSVDGPGAYTAQAIAQAEGSSNFRVDVQQNEAGGSTQISSGMVMSTATGSVLVNDVQHANDGGTMSVFGQTLNQVVDTGYDSAVASTSVATAANNMASTGVQYASAGVTTTESGATQITLRQTGGASGGYTAPSIQPGMIVESPSGQHSVVQEVSAASDGEWRVTVEEGVSSRNLMSVETTGREILNSSAARSGYNCLGGTAPNASGVMEIVYEAREDRAVAEQSVEQNFRQPGSQIQGSDGSTYNVVSVTPSNGARNVIVRLTKSIFGGGDGKGKPQAE